MSTIEETLTQLYLNYDSSDENFVKEIESALTNLFPYDHSKKDIFGACHMTEPCSFTLRGGKLSEVMEHAEKILTKRQAILALLTEIKDNGRRTMDSSEESLANLLDTAKSTLKQLRLISEERDEDSIKDDQNESKEPKLKTIPRTVENCIKTDSSECWKCRLEPNCTKFKTSK